MAVAEATTDVGREQELSVDLSQAVQSIQSKVTLSEGLRSGSAQRFLNDAQTALDSLSSLRGQIIPGTDGQAIMSHGAPLTYFSGTTAQRADSALYNIPQAMPQVSANGSPYSVYGNASDKNASSLSDYVARMNTANGGAIPVNPVEEIVLGNAAGKVIVGGAKLAGRLVLGEAAGVTTNSVKPIGYDISKWSEYGLPSDGYFSRTLSREQYLDLKAGRFVNFAGKPVEEYPGGMGFISSAGEARAFSTVKDYREGLKLAYDPSKYVLEFQLRDTAELQNVLKAPYPEFVPGGKTGAGFKKLNYPGLNNNDIINWRVRSLK